MLRYFRTCLIASLPLLVAFCSGCGGDAYEQQFDHSLKHLKDTGQPIPRAGIQPAAAPDGQAPAGQPAANPM
jgi:hypothetical protein